ncbi:MAG: collagenase [Clostridiaceae bacterium]|nr:collagenase [Clostridiaceae bacterium]
MKLIKIPNTLFYILIFITLIVVIIGETPFLMDKTARLVRNVKFKTITKNMVMKKLNNITFYYSDKKDETYINNIKDYLKVGEDKTTPIFGQTTMYPFNIIMFKTPESFGKALNVNSKEGGALTVFDSLYIPCDNINSYVLVHEYTHYKMSSFCKENGIQEFKIPSWFKEGVAEYASSALYPERFKNPKIQEMRDFKKLEKSSHMQEYSESYMQSYMAVRKIIEIKGQDSIQQILINTKSMTFYNAFEKVVGFSIENFQKLPQTDGIDVLLKAGLTYSQ